MIDGAMFVKPKARRRRRLAIMISGFSRVRKFRRSRAQGLRFRVFIGFRA